MTSLFSTKFFVNASNSLMSFGRSSGEDTRHHNVMCMYSSSGVRPGWLRSLVAISSMSGSFQWPGEEYVRHLSWPKPRSLMDFQLALMSPVVRQLFASGVTDGAFDGFKLFDKLKTMSRPLLRSA